MTDFIDAEVQRFCKRVEQVKFILSSVCNLLDAINDEELRSLTLAATADIRDMIVNILSGKAKNAHLNT